MYLMFGCVWFFSVLVGLCCDVQSFLVGCLRYFPTGDWCRMRSFVFVGLGCFSWFDFWFWFGCLIEKLLVLLNSFIV